MVAMPWAASGGVEQPSMSKIKRRSPIASVMQEEIMKRINDTSAGVVEKKTKLRCVAKAIKVDMR
jgi:hypothetical protein